MKKYILIASVLLLAACAGKPKEQKVMAREVPERADDFVFENNLIAGRFYGKALEGNPTSPGIDIWVKLPGALVANDWYAEAVKPGNGNYYHKDHGGKDCYKVAVSLLSSTALCATPLPTIAAARSFTNPPLKSASSSIILSGRLEM